MLVNVNLSNFDREKDHTHRLLNVDRCAFFFHYLNSTWVPLTLQDHPQANNCFLPFAEDLPKRGRLFLGHEWLLVAVGKGGMKSATGKIEKRNNCNISFILTVAGLTASLQTKKR